MVTTNDIFNIRSREEFDRAALELFAFQATECAPYREYLAQIAVDPSKVRHVTQIPFLPIELFKWREVYCGSEPPEIVFTSSNTGGTVASRHPMQSLNLYEMAFRTAFHQFYGDPAKWSLYGLLPNYLQRKGSSLIYMADRLIADCGSGGFYLNDYDRLLADMAADPKPKILLGVSYALWELAERYAPKLTDTIVMETGGMKGHREEIPKVEFHKILCKAFGVETIHSEYGMAELTSQAYSQGRGVFYTPAWMRVLTRDVSDPFEMLTTGTRGGINLIDLANRYSCAFIQTQDLGRTFEDGSFEIEGRIDRSDIRGCNLLVQ
ncbi:MAG: acyltransferase [Alistipes sp.]